MKIFFKFIRKSMLEKKGRLLLLILAIALSTGLFIASLGVVNMAIDSLVKPQLETYDNKEVLISSKEGEQFFEVNDIVSKGITNISKEINISGKYLDTKNDENKSITISGRESQYIENKNLINGSLKDFSGEKCIISKRISEDLNLDIGDTIEIILAGKNTKLRVEAIFANSSLFYNDNLNGFSILVPYEYISKELGVENKFNLVLADKTKDTTKESVKLFNKNNSNYEARELYNEEAIKNETSDFSNILFFMLIIVVFMSSIIIYSSFKLIVTERMPVIGTFLSQGATKKTIEKILYLESLGYGVIGSFFGVALGLGGLKLISRLISPLAEYGIYESFHINYFHVLIGITFALLLSFISGLIPIKKIRKLEVKDVILNNVSFSMSIGWSKFIIGMIIIAAALIVAFAKGDWTNSASIIFIFGTYIGVILVYPKVVDLITNVFYKIFRGRSKSLVFSLNNLRTSKVLLGNTSLIIISIMSIFMISSLGESMKDVVTAAYEDLDYDINITDISTLRQNGEAVSDEIVKKLEGYDGYVKDSNITVSENYGQMNDDDLGFTVLGVDLNKYSDYNNYLKLNKGENKVVYDKLKESKDGVIVGTALKDKFNLSAEKRYNLKINDINREVTVVGFFDSKLFYNGYLVLISDDILENLYGLSGGSNISIKTNKNPAKFKKEIKEISNEYGVTISTRAEDTKANNDQNGMIISVLNIFSFMAIIIAALGVLNNITIGFLQRKREIAILSSVGMANRNRNMMLIYESIITVFWAAVVSVPGSMLIVKLLSKMMNIMGLALDISYNFKAVPVYCLAAVVIVLIVTLPVVIKSKKLSIINELKYE